MILVGGLSIKHLRKEELAGNWWRGSEKKYVLVREMITFWLMDLATAAASSPCPSSSLRCSLLFPFAVYYRGRKREFGWREQLILLGGIGRSWEEKRRKLGKAPPTPSFYSFPKMVVQIFLWKWVHSVQNFLLIMNNQLKNCKNVTNGRKMRPKLINELWSTSTASAVYALFVGALLLTVTAKKRIYCHFSR